MFIVFVLFFRQRSGRRINGCAASFVVKVTEYVVKHAVVVVAVVVVFTVNVVKEITVLVTADERRSLHTCIEVHTPLFGGSKNALSRSLRLRIRSTWG